MSGEQRHEYRVVARTESSARFRPEDEVVFTNVPSRQGLVRVALRTRWQDAGLEAPIPRELWIETRGHADSLDAAVDAFGEAARIFGPIVAFTANVQVGMVDVHLAFDSTPGVVEREFMETFLPDETGSIREGRIVKPHLLQALVPALAEHPDWARLARALGHYELALRYWFFGGEALSLAHLFIAAENLTTAAVRAHCRAESCSEEELATSLGIDVNDPSRRRWKNALDAWHRLNVIFGGDSDVHRAARQASDGLEHGFMELSEVHARARTVTLKTFGYIRRAILNLVNLASEIKQELADIEPRDVFSLRKIIRGVFVGETDDPAAPDQEYPILTWNSSIARLWWEDDDLHMNLNENFKIHCAEGVSFRGQEFGVRVRTERGRPFTADPSDIEIIETY